MNPNEHFRKHTLVVIPARDEADTVGEIVARVLKMGFDALVVDDASNDQTAQKARASGAQVLSLPFNTGAWIAMQTGIRYALDEGYQHTVTLDADGQHDPAAIPSMAAALDPEHPANVVIGACHSRGSLPRHIAWSLFRHLGGLRISDLTSGYRIYDRRSMALVASSDATLLEYQDVGILLLLLRHGMVITEVEVKMTQRTTGKSRVFQSWLKVFYYMVSSTILCTSKFDFRRRLAGGHTKPRL